MHPEGHDKRRYYRFHREHGHDTEECHDLKNQIEDLIRYRHLRRYIRDQRTPPKGRPTRDYLPRPKGPIKKQINVIIDRPASGGDSSLVRKAYTRSMLEKRPKRDRDPKITFESGNEEYPDHDDALVILAWITNAEVKRVMIDMGSSVDILYFDAFQKLGLTNKDLISMTSALTKFTEDSISPLSMMALLVMIGEESRSKTLMISFMVVRLPSAYNTIISRSTLNKLRVVVSTYHYTMKFPTRVGVSEIRNDPRESRQCYLTAAGYRCLASQSRE
ncbi:hypothetical protein BHM03_00018874 [Ensete ventricosum]|uniref:Reverse transcriptase domain-containing protein n=1 Tax=Ensete ventricosum TaxID=4639 RepID=A0A445MFD4_ENSVE|nr:hypothetical protein BHM03_00018874 [Ensete ventricosum]